MSVIRDALCTKDARYDEALDALASLESQNQALQERIEGALRYLDKCQRDGREIGGRPLRNLLSPTQETDPE